jgi:hypothetical protein
MCPRCKSVLESPEQKAGDKVSCPKCQQRLQVPGLPRDKTILAPPVPSPSSPSSPIPPQAIPVVLEEIPNPSRRKKMAMLVCACVVFLTLICGWLVGRGIFGTNGTASVPKDASNKKEPSKQAQPVPLVEKRKEPRLPEEKIAKDWLIEKANDPSSIECDQWGPHDLVGELGARWPPAAVWPDAPVPEDTRKPAQLLRVVFRGKNPFGAKVMHDWILILSDGKIRAVETNLYGDEWKEQAKEGIAKQRTNWQNFGIFYPNQNAQQEKMKAKDGIGTGAKEFAEQEKKKAKDKNKGAKGPILTLDDLQQWIERRRTLEGDFAGNNVKLVALQREAKEEWNKKFKSKRIRLEGQVFGVSDFSHKLRGKYVISGGANVGASNSIFFWSCATDQSVIDLKNNMRLEIVGSIANDGPENFFLRWDLELENGEFKKKK